MGHHFVSGLHTLKPKNPKNFLQNLGFSSPAYGVLVSEAD